MKTFRMTVKGGHLVSDETVDLPEGAILQVIEDEETPEIRMMTEEEQGDSPEEIAKWIADFEAIPPLVMSPEEEADLLAWRAKTKAFNLAAIRREWEQGIVE